MPVRNIDRPRLDGGRILFSRNLSLDWTYGISSRLRLRPDTPPHQVLISTIVQPLVGLSGLPAEIVAIGIVGRQLLFGRQAIS